MLKNYCLYFQLVLILDMSTDFQDMNMILFVNVNIWNTVACAKGKYESLPEQSFLFKSPNAIVFCLFLEKLAVRRAQDGKEFTSICANLFAAKIKATVPTKILRFHFSSFCNLFKSVHQEYGMYYIHNEDSHSCAIRTIAARNLRTYMWY